MLMGRVGGPCLTGVPRLGGTGRAAVTLTSAVVTALLGLC